MKLLALLLGASVVVAITPDQCHDRISFNRTNAADMADCARLTYECRGGSDIFWDSTSGVALPSHCTTKKRFLMYFSDPGLTGPIALPGVVEADNIEFRAGFKARDNITTAEIDAWRNNTSINDSVIYDYTGGMGIQPLTISSIDLPDLVNITWVGMVIEDLTNLSSITMPKLENVAGSLYFRLSGPAISLSFPKLYQVETGIYLTGNIDALDFPALNSSHRINVTTTGNLDCVAFAKRVVNTTVWPVVDRDPANWNSSVVCNSNKASVTMHPEPPEVSDKESSGSRSGLGFYGNLMPLAIVVAVASWVV